MERLPRHSGLRRHVLILLVEDSRSDVRLIEETFKEAELEADLRVVENGEEAIRYLRQSGDFTGAARPELILLDLSLPSIDGRQVLAEVRSDPALNGIPLVVFTSSKVDNDVEFAFNFHADGYIRKPLTVDGLQSVIRQFGLVPRAESEPQPSDNVQPRRDLSAGPSQG